jgi:hypothetical protein
MKKFLSTVIVGVAAWALPGAGTVNAADFRSQEIAVPFAFKVDKITLPAGHYRVEQNVGKHVTFIVNMQTGHRVQIIRENGNDPTGNSKLTFERTPEGYKLSKVS